MTRSRWSGVAVVLWLFASVPMAISGSAAFFPRGAKVVVPGQTMRLTFGPPVPTAGLAPSERNRLISSLEATVRELFGPHV